MSCTKIIGRVAFFFMLLVQFIFGLTALNGAENGYGIAAAFVLMVPLAHMLYWFLLCALSPPHFCSDNPVWLSWLMYVALQWIPHVLMKTYTLEDDVGKMSFGNEIGSMNVFTGILALSVFIFVTLVYSFSKSIKADLDKKFYIVTAIDLFDCVEMLEFNMLPEYKISIWLRLTINAFAILLFLSPAIALHGMRRTSGDNGNGMFPRDRHKEKNRTDLITSLIGLLVNLAFLMIRCSVASTLVAKMKNFFFAVIHITDAWSRFKEAGALPHRAPVHADPHRDAVESTDETSDSDY